MADLYQQAARFRKDLLAGERRAASELVKAYGVAYSRITSELERVTAEVVRQRAAGVLDKDIPALLYRQGRLQVMQDKVRDEVGRFAGKADIIVGGAIGEAAEKGTQHAATLIDIALPEGVSVTPSGRRLPDGSLSLTPLAAQEIGLATGAAEQITAVTRSSAPVGRLLAELGPQAAKAATDALISGTVMGKNPKVIAREMRGALGGNLTRALTIARTETLRAYREASRGVYRDNADVLRGWIWIADIGPRTCPSCFAQHGSVHDLSEVMATHPRCRCTMAPATKPWRELGFGDTPESVQIEDGPTAFRSLSAADQRRVLGPAKYEAYRNRDITLPDLVAKRQSPVWGPSTQEASLRAAKDNAALRRAGGGQPPAGTTPPAPPAPDPDDFLAELDAIRARIGSFGSADEAVLSQQVDALIDAGNVITREVERRGSTQPPQAMINRLDELADERNALRDQYRAVRDIADEDEFARRLQELNARAEAIETEQTALRTELGELGAARRKTVMDVLGEIRDMGYRAGDGPPITSGATGQAARLARDGSRFLPRGWLEQMNRWATGESLDAAERARAELGQLLRRGRRRATSERMGITTRMVQRGHWEGMRRVLSISKRASAPGLPDGLSVAVHEMTHWAESSIPALRQLQAAFYRRRTTLNGVREPTRRMSTLRPGWGYARNEITREDKFADPYMGKDYGDRLDSHYEILTMGIERALATDVDWARIDAQHLSFIYGLLALI